MWMIVFLFAYAVFSCSGAVCELREMLIQNKVYDSIYTHVMVHTGPPIGPLLK
jgi:hypothetical protein